MPIHRNRNFFYRFLIFLLIISNIFSVPVQHEEENITVIGKVAATKLPEPALKTKTMDASERCGYSVLVFVY
jgi:hypothetical protein